MGMWPTRYLVEYVVQNLNTEIKIRKQQYQISIFIEIDRSNR